MSYLQIPLEMLFRSMKLHPEYRLYFMGGCALSLLLAALVFWFFRRYFTFIFKSLSRNLVRTILASL
ncbi:MAG TPA: hypothetical protein VGY66_03770, partial [Gemmataceae bacterium]|nr:hypothetical protein [Gemmataceae bacterium]